MLERSTCGTYITHLAPQADSACFGHYPNATGLPQFRQGGKLPVVPKQAFLRHWRRSAAAIAFCKSVICRDRAHCPCRRCQDMDRAEICRRACRIMFFADDRSSFASEPLSWVVPVSWNASGSEPSVSSFPGPPIYGVVPSKLV